jgi:hypothetical protein
MKTRTDALVSRMDAHQAKIKANHEELMAAMKACQRIESPMDVSLETTKACLEQIEANQGKVELKMEGCLEEMEVVTIGALDGPIGGPATGHGIPEPTEKADQGRFCTSNP